MSLMNWSLDTVVSDTLTNLVESPVGKETALVSINICNFSGSDALFEIGLYSSLDVRKAQLMKGTIEIGQTITYDSKLFLDNASQDKIKVKSSQVNVSFIASGDQT